MFQFEIGVQSTLSATLDAIDRKVCLERLTANVQQLRSRTEVELHLDLVAGLPGEGYRDFLDSIDRVAALSPDHLQIEPVKLLPGSPLRDQAHSLGIRFDPNPPYTVLATPDLNYVELQHICELTRLLDLTWNAGCLTTFLTVLAEHSTSLSRGLEELAGFWRNRGLFRYPLNRQTLFEHCWQFAETLANGWRQRFKDALGYDYARCERVTLKRLPDFFDTALHPAESDWVQQQIADKMLQIRGQGIKLQYFSAAFHNLPQHFGRTVLLFCYQTQSEQGMRIEEFVCPSD